MKAMFGPKRFGWGFSPRGWRGYGFTFVVVMAGIFGARYLHGVAMGIAETALIIGFFVVVALTYSRNA